MNKKLVKAIWAAFVGGIVFLLLLVFFIKINLFGLFGELPGFQILENPKTDEASLLYSSDGVVLGSYYREKRTPVEYEALPKHLVDALIATEDERFLSHSGIDFKGTFAIFYYMIQGKRRGSSTLSQQTAKNLFKLRASEKYQGPLSENLLVTKIKEWMVAIQIERSYTKKEIITMYFNTVSFGRQTFGIKNAAETYFNTSLENLTLNQAALLVGLLKGPSFYDPIRHEDRALIRRSTVLGQMVKNHYLEESKKSTLEKEPLGLKYKKEGVTTGLAPYLRNYLKPFAQKWAFDRNYDLYGDGLRIVTTVDSKMQKYLEGAVQRHMKLLQKQYKNQWKNKMPWKDKEFINNLARKTSRYQNLKKEGHKEKEIFRILAQPVQTEIFTWGGSKEVKMSPLDSIKHSVQILHTGVLSVNPHNGHIKAYIGDIDYGYFKYDNVYQSRRQPGSTFKPIVYAYAMEEKGFTPCSEVLDVEVAYPWGGGVWSPKNSNGQYLNQPVTLKYGLANSVNSVAANLMMQSGPENIVRFARNLGIESDMEPVPALALGALDVSLIEMVSAYCAFVNGGTYIKPFGLLRIEDKYGNVLEEFKPQTREVISEKTAYYIIELLKEGSETGTSSALKNHFGINAEIGGKTGTTQDGADGWFIGVSPELVTGVWVGGQNRNIRLIGGYGASLAMPIWGHYMKSVFDDKSLEVDKAGYKWRNSMPSIDCFSKDSLNNDLPLNDVENFIDG